jgi:hypothetical protein
MIHLRIQKDSHKKMKAVRLEIYLGSDRALLQSRALAGREPSLPPKPYVVEVRALHEETGVLSTRYGSLFQQWKIVMAQNKSLRARLSKLKHIFPITRINAHRRRPPHSLFKTGRRDYASASAFCRPIAQDGCHFFHLDTLQ